jgi:hypothetical protein
VISTEKPGTPAELAHHGTKGMKWGVKRGEKPSSSDIYRARARSNLRLTEALTEPEKSKRKELVDAYNNHPDRAVALRYTNGEKAIHGLLAASGVATIPIGVAATARVISRKRLEKKLSAA